MLPRKDFLVFSKPRFGDEEIDEIIQTLRSGWVGTGPRAHQFEKDFAEYVKVPFAIAVNSCTAALHLSYVSLDLKPGDEVIVPAMTFGATANAVVHAGGRPVFVDVEEETYCIDPKAVESAITPRTKAVVAVHFAGKLARIEELSKICSHHKIELIEDCAHAIETAKAGKHAGTWGRSGCFSFYATKNVSTAEGGMFITSDPKVAERVRKLSLHGMSKDAHRRFSSDGYSHYNFDEFGFKYNMPDIAAALGIHQLRKIDAHRKRRQALWEIYDRGLQDSGFKCPSISALPSQEVHALHLYQIRVPHRLRDQALQEFAKAKIGVGVHYQALVDLPIYQQFLKSPRDLETMFPVARAFGAETISLPLGTDMSEEDARDVVACAHEIAEKLKISR